VAAALGLAPTAVTAHAGEYVVHARATPALIADLACHLRDVGVGLISLDAGRRSLEAVFLQIASESDAREPAR
jgi:hypothetical protein